MGTTINLMFITVGLMLVVVTYYTMRSLPKLWVQWRKFVKVRNKLMELDEARAHRDNPRMRGVTSCDRRPTEMK